MSPTVITTQSFTDASAALAHARAIYDSGVAHLRADAGRQAGRICGAQRGGLGHLRPDHQHAEHVGLQGRPVGARCRRRGAATTMSLIERLLAASTARSHGLAARSSRAATEWSCSWTTLSQA